MEEIEEKRILIAECLIPSKRLGIRCISHQESLSMNMMNVIEDG